MRESTGEFHVRSIEQLGTLEQDADVGVVRVPPYLMRKLGGRHRLVQVCVMRGAERTARLTRIMRAGTGAHALKKNEIALQYDDRLALGIKSDEDTHVIELRSRREWIGLVPFFWHHPSPLVRRETFFAVALAAGGTAVGFILGAAL